jgi:hypothetical protein
VIARSKDGNLKIKECRDEKKMHWYELVDKDDNVVDKAMAYEELVIPYQQSFPEEAERIKKLYRPGVVICVRNGIEYKAPER